MFVRPSVRLFVLSTFEPIKAKFRGTVRRFLQLRFFLSFSLIPKYSLSPCCKNHWFSGSSAEGFDIHLRLPGFFPFFVPSPLFFFAGWSAKKQDAHQPLMHVAFKKIPKVKERIDYSAPFPIIRNDLVWRPLLDVVQMQMCNRFRFHFWVTSLPPFPPYLPPTPLRLSRPLCFIFEVELVLLDDFFLHLCT